MDSEPILHYDVDNRIALLRIQRPKVRNALNTPLLEALNARLDEAAADDEVRVVVISSNDQMALSAGLDLTEGDSLDEAGRLHRAKLFTGLYDRLVSLDKPTIAACHGACIGGGAELAVACDLRVAGGNMRMKFVGAMMDTPVGPARLVTLCGLSVAKYALLTAKEIDADMAYRWGLVHKVVPAAATENQALTLAAAVADHEPAAVARLKRMLHEWDGIEERSRAEGAGQIEWAREGRGAL